MSVQGAKTRSARAVAAGVYLLVEYADSHVGHAYLVNIGVAQGEFEGCLAPVLADDVPLAAGVAGGLGDLVEQAVGIVQGGSPRHQL